jgi:hypothetical protein
MLTVFKRAPKQFIIEGSLVAKFTAQNNWEVKEGFDTLAIINKEGENMTAWGKLCVYQITHLLAIMKQILAQRKRLN